MDKKEVRAFLEEEIDTRPPAKVADVASKALKALDNPDYDNGFPGKGSRVCVL